ESRLPVRVQQSGRTETPVRAAAREPSFEHAVVAILPLRLPVRPERSALVRPFIPIKTEPLQVRDDALLGLSSGSFGVGVLDAQHERAAVPPRKQPVEQRRTRVPDVKLACRTRRKPQPHRTGSARVSSATACAAIASPRPTASTPSFVFPFTLTQSVAMSRIFASLSTMAGMCGESFGRSSTIVTSTFATAQPAL